ncbi:MAG: ATPase [Coriobacteriales bacterium]|jgi:cell division septum initiation protein DivIVA|nr:ATPase [Coriobacteriales bacterium]
MDETSSVLELIDELTSYIEDGKPSLGNKDKRSIDVGPAFDILEEIRQRFPAEIAQAKQVLRQSDEILSDAHAKADHIIEDASQQALVIAGQQEIMRIAQSQSDELLENARKQERSIRSGSEEFAESVLDRVESTLNTLLETVHRSQDRMGSSN